MEVLMNATFRPATPQDAAGILAIYAPIVRDTAISFEVEPPTVPEMQQRISQTLQKLPWLVCECQGDILGYVYASPHRARAAYQWSVDVSVYVHADLHRSGIGRGLYTALFSLLYRQGFYNLYAGITLPNDGSVGLHEALGFQPVGIYRSVGFKFGIWHDVGWWHLPLRSGSRTPEPPTAFDTIRQDQTMLDAARAAGLPFLKI
jgi:phosphinothricin acetyltransferase